jgi:hypothetical protein
MILQYSEQQQAFHHSTTDIESNGYYNVSTDKPREWLIAFVVYVRKQYSNPSLEQVKKAYKQFFHA